mgnify:CR=1 FL=1
MGWLAQAADGSVVLVLHIQPGARKTEVAGLHGDALKIRLAAPPVDGKANAALLAWLAAELRCPKRDLALLRGESGRRKQVQLALPEQAVATWLDRVLCP